MCFFLRVPLEVPFQRYFSPSWNRAVDFILEAYSQIPGFYKVSMENNSRFKLPLVDSPVTAFVSPPVLPSDMESFVMDPVDRMIE